MSAALAALASAVLLGSSAYAAYIFYDRSAPPRCHGGISAARASKRPDGRIVSTSTPVSGLPRGCSR